MRAPALNLPSMVDILNFEVDLGARCKMQAVKKERKLPLPRLSKLQAAVEVGTVIGWARKCDREKCQQAASEEER